MSARGQYLDSITWKRNAAAAGDPVPSYTSTLATMPCKITPTGGAETFRGKQLDANVDYVVEMDFSAAVGGVMNTTDQGTVAAGFFAGKILNVERISNLPLSQGRPPITEVYCREGS